MPHQRPFISLKSLEPNSPNTEAIDKASTVEEPNSFKLLRAYQARLNEYINKGGKSSTIYGTSRTISKGVMPTKQQVFQKPAAKAVEDLKTARAGAKAEKRDVTLTGDAAEDEELKQVYERKLTRWNLCHHEPGNSISDECTRFPYTVVCRMSRQPVEQPLYTTPRLYYKFVSK
ncbi:uncharacterized protein MYCFIDRAFT_173911 [Pseudocercospora fijiensis CIRAD86]|uniref:Uncharacterized protein n=1 Tax=Pseudocercospora fijiensis (strain CIRAD86) TaxID=383855 RepID=M2Z5E8_PSEFD|nr:uncharacterized protein MYCFIDRAFT_173911 [Pseudocercospora fijiensis CIRAD86]EME85040.1 hypothetical protein MYCFIDRAFT_173911 [Pseudocercospora fijiensis CIRAD86]